MKRWQSRAVQIEAILNSRPLTPLSSDRNDFSPLTLAHFLIGRRFDCVIDPSLQYIKESRLSIWQRLQQIQQNLWERWNKEYISELQQRTKWRSPFPIVPRDALVWIKEDIFHRLSGNWEELKTHIPARMALQELRQYAQLQASFVAPSQNYVHYPWKWKLTHKFDVIYLKYLS